MPQANDNHITPTRRARIEDQIERLIAALDAADAPEIDLEPIGDDEGTAWRETHGGGGAACNPANEDDEPSLAHTNEFNQARARKLLTVSEGWEMHDLETEHDGREPDEDREPSLGWAIGMGWGDSLDLEESVGAP